LKLNGTHQLLVYAEDIDLLGGSLHSSKKKVGPLEAANKEIGLE
jgi:hypothetical protein